MCRDNANLHFLLFLDVLYGLLLVVFHALLLGAVSNDGAIGEDQYGLQVLASDLGVIGTPWTASLRTPFLVGGVVWGVLVACTGVLGVVYINREEGWRQSRCFHVWIVTAVIFQFVAYFSNQVLKFLMLFVFTDEYLQTSLCQDMFPAFCKQGERVPFAWNFIQNLIIGGFCFFVYTGALLRCLNDPGAPDTSTEMAFANPPLPVMGGVGINNPYNTMSSVSRDRGSSYYAPLNPYNYQQRGGALGTTSASSGQQGADLTSLALLRKGLPSFEGGGQAPYGYRETPQSYNNFSPRTQSTNQKFG